MEKTIQSGIPSNRGEGESANRLFFFFDGTNRLVWTDQTNIFKQVLTPYWINLTKVNIFKPNKLTNLISNGD